jgi:hypothetical protein
MEQYINLIDYRFIEDTEDTEFNFFFLKSNDFCYMFIDKNKVEFKSIENLRDIRKNIRLNRPVSYTALYEGLFDNNIFYITDILVRDNLPVNLNYKERYNICKNDINKDICNTNISILKMYYNTTIENLLTYNIGTLKFKPQYIYMCKNMEKHLLDLSDIKAYDAPARVEPSIKLNTDILDKREYENIEVFKTNQPEIYCFVKNNVKHILLVKNLDISKKLEVLFQKNKIRNLNVKYNDKFKKYEIIM